MKNRFFKISTIIFVAICMCVSLVACSSDEVVATINTHVDNFSATYDNETHTSSVMVDVSVRNTSDGVDISGFSYNIRFADANGSIIYEEKVECSNQISAGESTVITKQYSVAGQVAHATAIPNSANPIVSNESDESEGCANTGTAVGGGSAASTLLIIGGIYLAYKFFFEEN